VENLLASVEAGGKRHALGDASAEGIVGGPRFARK
jgi:hypothetical protein